MTTVQDLFAQLKLLEPDIRAMLGEALSSSTAILIDATGTTYTYTRNFTGGGSESAHERIPYPEPVSSPVFAPTMPPPPPPVCEPPPPAVEVAPEPQPVEPTPEPTPEPEPEKKRKRWLG
jgi:hypothetical protein